MRVVLATASLNLVLAQPLTGFWLLYLLGVPLTSTWVWVSLLLYVVVGFCWIPVVAIQIRVARLAAGLHSQALAPSSEFRRLMRWWYGLGWPAFLAVVAIFWLMVFKPQ